MTVDRRGSGQGFPIPGLGNAGGDPDGEETAHEKTGDVLGGRRRFGDDYWEPCRVQLQLLQPVPVAIGAAGADPMMPPSITDPPIDEASMTEPLMIEPPVTEPPMTLPPIAADDAGTAT